LLLLWLVTFAAYWPSLGNGFTNWDDDKYVTENPAIRELSVDRLESIFSQSYTHTYVPLTILSFALEYQVAGLEPWLYHLDNLLLHLCNTSLVWCLLLTLTKRRRAALVGALLFGVHPLHVESVAWVTERKDVLYTAFFLGALLAYGSYLASQKARHYLLALVLSVLSLLSKGQAVAITPTLILLDAFHGRPLLARRVLVEKLPFLVLSLVFGAVALAVGELHEGLAAGASSIVGRLPHAGYAFLHYLVKLAVPYELSAVYAEPASRSLWISCGILVAVVIAFSWLVAVRRSRTLLFGAVFFSVNIVFMLQTLPLGTAFLADRFVYVASIGWFLVAGGVYDWVRTHGRRQTAVAAAGALLVYLTGLSVLTHQRCEVWRDGVSLWNDVIARYDAIPLAYYNRGIAYEAEGRLEAAIRDYDRAIELSPEYVSAYLKRGVGRAKLERWEGALGDFGRVLSVDPENAWAHQNRANVHYLLGNHRAAIEDLDRAIALDPEEGRNYLNRGALLTETGEIGRACEDFEAAIRLGVPGAARAMAGWCGAG
jgi:regulator of sirC expression with transglutaminase-like and TPR domain